MRAVGRPVLAQNCGLDFADGHGLLLLVVSVLLPKYFIRVLLLRSLLRRLVTLVIDDDVGPCDVLLIKNFLQPLDKPAIDRVTTWLRGHLHDHACLLLRHVERLRPVRHLGSAVVNIVDVLDVFVALVVGSVRLLVSVVAAEKLLKLGLPLLTGLLFLTHRVGKLDNFLNNLVLCHACSYDLR